MHRNQSGISAGGVVVLFVVLLNAIIIRQGFVAGTGWYQFLYVTVPLLLLVFVFRRRPL
ncbi:hypothetical protein [Flavisolibacter ginsenosidimutans]|uniref:hypothetical protein n=1 Tax=Flavisolibacter ginsenosidimutans TaxID=661481 RepID=UPI00155A07C6|nr:hypothetical protein [Flavisolibacter ginsenosidimutans]